MPLPVKEKRITLGAVGSPELFVLFKRVGGMKYGEFLDLFGDDVESEDSDSEKLSQRDITQKRWAGMIIDWNIPHDHTICSTSCDDENRVLVLPNQNPSVIFDIPRAFAELISHSMLLDSLEERDGFLDSATESETDSILSSLGLESKVETRTNGFRGGLSKFTSRIGSILRRGMSERA